MTWRAQGDQPPCSSGRYEPNAAQPLAAVATSREPRQPCRRADKQPADLVRALQPEVVRRHRHDGVVAEERDERLDVVALEGVDVAAPGAPAASSSTVASASGSSPSRSASVARARWSALLTDATLVSSSSATSVACQRSTSRRMSTARWRGGRCCSAVTNASRMLSRAAATSAGSAPSGRPGRRRSADPRVLGPSDAREGVGGRRRPDVHGPRPALAAAQHVEAHVGRDPVEPRAQRRPALEGVDAASTPAPSSPARRRRPRTPSRASGSSTR